MDGDLRGANQRLETLWDENGAPNPVCWEVGEREKRALLPQLLEGRDGMVTALLALLGQPESSITVKGTVEMVLSPRQTLVLNSRSQSIGTSG